jgi:predicted ATPase with chaperone activity
VPPSKSDLERAFGDLLISPKMFARLGPALAAGRGLFLYGSPGNGKTSIAERLTRAYSEHIWIPRALGLDGEIMRVFDPMVHQETPLPPPSSVLDHPSVDRRWVRIRRPTLVVGGELTMDSLEVSYNPAGGVCEAPVQLKSNCGTLVIDDLGRQRISVEQLMNRWIVPLERRQDYLNLPKGKKIQVPFEQLVVFSTNLEPKDMVDESFLRRIPYKIEVLDPDEAEFRVLLRRMCVSLGLECREEAIEYLIRRHYQGAGRPYRFCHARDLLLQVRHYCVYHELPLRIAPELFDFAVDTYFSAS